MTQKNIIVRITIVFFIWYFLFSFLDDLLGGGVERTFSPILFLYLAGFVWILTAIFKLTKH